jgi:hypothetical protein
MKRDVPANPIERPGYVLEFNDEFAGSSLDETKWVPYHLPQWSSRSQSAANARFVDGHLELRIDAGQKPWCPEYDGDIKCASLQTGLFAGPVGSTRGQHRFNREAVVREAQENRVTYTPTYGYFELRAKGSLTPGNHFSLWMIGYEDEPDRSSEICIFEAFGKNAGPTSSKVTFGVHPFGDARIVDDFRIVELPIDFADFHIYAAEWTPDHIDYFVDNQKIGTVDQSPAYPMQFMLGLYEKPQETRPLPSGEPGYPKTFVVDYMRAYKPVGGYKRP